MIFYKYISEFLFIAFIMLVFLGSLLAVRAKVLMHGVLGLAVSILGVSGLYFYLGSMFLTLMQVLIYVGAVCIVIAFGVMVGKTPTEVEGLKLKAGIFGMFVSAVVFILLIFSIKKTSWKIPIKMSGDFSIEHLGYTMLTKYCLAFELISVLLLAAIVGAIIIARGGREEINS
ncbi:MAG: NADH-quinone oxidoreductase subunit J [Desulfobacterales bacterium]|nr:NADH-quinone oxidoreductase subunit J [Desulfobacterales bacterium]